MMGGIPIGELAVIAAANYLESLDVPVGERDADIIRSVYVVGWIQGAYAGANEARPSVCERRPLRRSSTQCTTRRKG